MTDTFRTLCAELVEALRTNDYYDEKSDEMAYSGLLKRACAALAQPEPVGPTDEEILALSQWHGVSYTMCDGGVIYPMQQGTDMKEEVLSFARAVLARWGRPAITPVPVSERLPGPEDCDAEGRCWYFSYETVIGGANWQLFTEEEQEGFVPPTHWLPAHALPLPNSTGEL